MSYQVNFRVYVPGCEYYEAEIAAALATEIQLAVQKLMRENGVVEKSVGVTSGEVTYLSK